ncbi:MAG: LuxR C-terminal-related transcriptional regulator [bacterium]|nr:LuxR C-terminal-related transcriptional regulator [bacterium]
MINITKHKKAEDDIKESEEIFESVVDNIGIGVSLISPAMEILSMNKQMKKWFPDIDVTKKPVCYRAFNKPPKKIICHYCPTHKTLKNGQVYESITETPAGGKIINYRIISSAIKNKEGKIIAAIEMVEDITRRKEVEDALKKSKEELRKQKLVLEQKNLALKEMLEHIERTKIDMKENIAINVNEILLPILKKLKIKGASSKYTNLLQYHLETLVSSFGYKITEKNTKLTTREIEICNILKGGLTSKDASELLNISRQTIEKHRKNIRKKLNISNEKVNLISFLQRL